MNDENNTFSTDTNNKGGVTALWTTDSEQYVEYEINMPDGYEQDEGEGIPNVTGDDPDTMEMIEGYNNSPFNRSTAKNSDHVDQENVPEYEADIGYDYEYDDFDDMPDTMMYDDSDRCEPDVTPFDRAIAEKKAKSQVDEKSDEFPTALSSNDGDFHHEGKNVDSKEDTIFDSVNNFVQKISEEACYEHNQSLNSPTNLLNTGWNQIGTDSNAPVIPITSQPQVNNGLAIVEDISSETTSKGVIKVEKYNEVTSYAKIIDEIRAKYHFVNLNGTLLVWERRCYLPLSFKKFVIFLRRGIKRRISRQTTDFTIRQVYSMLLAEVPEVTDQHFDNHSHYLVFLDGILDIFTMQRFSLTPNIFVMGNLPVSIDCLDNYVRPNIFLSHLERVCNGDHAAMDFQFEFTGYLLSNFNTIKSCISGKSTHFRFHETLIGAEFCSHVPFHKLGDRFMLAQLYGKKLNNGGEISAIRLKDDGIFKSITGLNDTIVAEYKGQDAFSFKPNCKCVFQANDLESLQMNKLNSESVRNRIKLVPFFGSIPEVHKDNRIIEKWNAEIPGIMYLAIEGLRRLVQNNFQFTRYSAEAALNHEFDISINSTLYRIREFIDTFCFFSHTAAVSMREFVFRLNTAKNLSFTEVEFSRKYTSVLEEMYPIRHQRKRVDGSVNPISSLIGIGFKQNEGGF